MLKEKQQSRKMKECGKCIVLLKSLGERKAFSYCTFKRLQNSMHIFYGLQTKASPWQEEKINSFK